MAEKKWNGQGKPPSRRAAIEWLADKAGVSVAVAAAEMPKSGTLTEAGKKARQLAQVADAIQNHKPGIMERVGDTLVGGDDAFGFNPFANEGSGRLNASVSRGNNPNPRRPGSGRPVQRPTRRDPGGDQSSDQPAQDTNQDGTISPDEIVAQGGDTDDYGMPDMPTEGMSTRGAPLWPYETAGMSDEEVAGIKVTDQDPMAAYGRRHRPAGGDQNVKIGARYFSADTLAPLKWSAERRADLQRVLHGIGVYGDAKIQLGSWTAKDQSVYAELLARANVEGLRWEEMLVRWKKNPPQDILAEIESEKPKRPAVMLSNPMEITDTSRDVSKNLTGEVDREFVQSTVAPYQGMEAAEQNAAYDTDQAGTGASVIQAPSIEAFAEDKLRRENPIEVDGYQFLNQFQAMLSMFGGLG